MTIKMSSKFCPCLMHIVKHSLVFRVDINTNTRLHRFLHLDTKESNDFDSLEKLKNETLAKMVAFWAPIALPDFQTLIHNNRYNYDRLKTICFELNTMKLRGERVPSTISLHRWTRLLAFNDIALLRKYLAYLVYLENKQHLFEKMREAAVSQCLKTRPKDGRNHAFMKSQFYFLPEECIIKLKNFKLFQASMFGTHLLVDCCYETIIPNRDVYYCAEFMEQLWKKNRSFRDPFHIIFCNLDESGALMMELGRRIRDLKKLDFPFYSTSRNYLEMYPKEKLVYLTPHCKEILNKFSPDDIYIIGGLVDQQNNICEPMSFIKAEKDGVRKAKFPLNLYLRWGDTKETLTMNVVVSILNDMKDTNDWKCAFRHVPKRKLIES